MDIDLSNKVVTVLSFDLPKRRDLKSYTFQRENGKILSYNRARRRHNFYALHLLKACYLVFDEPYIPMYSIKFKGGLRTYCVLFKPHEENDLLIDEISKFFGCSIVEADLEQMTMSYFPANATSQAISNATYTFMSDPSVRTLRALMSAYMGYDAESTSRRIVKELTSTWPGVLPTMLRMNERRKFESNYRTYSKVTNIPSSVRRIATVTNTTILKDGEPFRLEFDTADDVQPERSGIQRVLSRMTVTVGDEEANTDRIEGDSNPPRLES